MAQNNKKFNDKHEILTSIGKRRLTYITTTKYHEKQ